MRITLDAGHVSGTNVSLVYPSYNEGDMTWVLTNYLAGNLRAKGHEVILTRTKRDKDLPVYDRGLLSGGSDLFLSIHSNGVDSNKVRRVVVIPPFVDRNNTYDLAKRLGSVIEKTMGIQNEPYQLYTRTYISGGKTYDYYGVIRGSVAAGCKRSIILEHSFHSNRESAIWLSDKINLSRLANAEANEIDNFLRNEKSENEFQKAYKVGDKYFLTSEDIYTNNKKPASFVINKYYTILKVSDSGYLLSDIVSWVKRHDTNKA